MKTLIITGGRFNKEFAACFLEKNRYDYIIAVDKGLQYAKELGVLPNLVVGDFDSCSIDLSVYEAKGVMVRKFKPEKDDTDTEIAVREAVGLNIDVDIICGTGGRLDHFFATVHNLYIAAQNGLEARLVDEKNIVYVATHSFSLERDKCFGKYISFIPFDGVVKNIKLKGFKYTLDGYDLSPGSSRCVSNEIVDAHATVYFDSGNLIVVESLDVESE